MQVTNKFIGLKELLKNNIGQSLERTTTISAQESRSNGQNLAGIPNNPLIMELKELLHDETVVQNLLGLSLLTKELVAFFLDKHHLDSKLFQTIINTATLRRTEMLGEGYPITHEEHAKFNEYFGSCSASDLYNVLTKTTQEGRSAISGFEFERFSLKNSDLTKIKFTAFSDSRGRGIVSSNYKKRNAYHALKWIENMANNIQFFIEHKNAEALVRYLQILDAGIGNLKELKSISDKIDKSNERAFED
jgi:hypothetical protein